MHRQSTLTLARVDFLADAEVNAGQTEADGILGYLEDATKDRIFFTFVGIGLECVVGGGGVGVGGCVVWARVVRCISPMRHR